jgi:hypothetical protein
MCDKKKKPQLLFSYTVEDGEYLNSSLKYIAGQQDAVPGNVGTIGNPANSNAPIASALPDPVVFSYAYQNSVRELLVKIDSKGGTPSSAVYTLLAPPNPPAEGWQVLANNITLADGSPPSPPAPVSPVANNPHGLAQVGDFLYLIDYEARKIYILGVNELNDLAAGSTHTLVNNPFDVGAAALLPPDAKGQAIIALAYGGGTYIFALYIDSDPAGQSYGNSILVKLTVSNDGTLAYKDKIEGLGLNAQSIHPVTLSDGTTRLLIPAIGGMQQGGYTNLSESVINSVEPFATPLAASVLLQGDNPTPSPATYDFRELAASFRADDNGNVFILTATFDAKYNQNWILYKAKAASLLKLANTSISAAVTSGVLSRVDSGQGDPGYFWDILYENGDGPANDRLWLVKGAPIYVTLADSYGTSAIAFGTGTADGQIGGQVINAVDLTAETVAQAKAGVSLKRGLRGTAPKIAEEEKK